MIQTLLNDDLILDMAALMLLYSVEFRRFCTFQTQSVHAKAYANPIKVSGEGSVVSEATDFSERLEERFLGNILRLMSVSEQVGGSSDQAVAMPSDKMSKSGLVANTAT